MISNRFLMWIAAIVSLSLVSGCASTPTDPASMAAIDYVTKNPQPYSVSIETGGGQDTSAIGGSKVSNEDLASAIEKSILETKVFEQLMTEEQGDYVLTAYMVTLDQPSVGMSLTVEASIAWRLTNASSGQAVWEEVIRSKYVAGAGEAFAFVKRLRKATEGAVKTNIGLALAKLEALPL